MDARSTLRHCGLLPSKVRAPRPIRRGCRITRHFSSIDITREMRVNDMNAMTERKHTIRRSHLHECLMRALPVTFDHSHPSFLLSVVIHRPRQYLHIPSRHDSVSVTKHTASRFPVIHLRQHIPQCYAIIFSGATEISSLLAELSSMPLISRSSACGSLSC